MKKKIKKVKINFFNIVILITAVISSVLLIHDFLFWGVIPMFIGNFYCLTYFGMFLDLIAIGLLECSIQNMSEWFK